MLRNLTLTVLLLIASHIMVWGQVSVTQQLDSMEMLIGEHVHLSISATVPEGKQVKFPQFKEGSEMIPGIEVLAVSPTDSAKKDNNLLTLTKTYTLTSFDDTLYYIPPQPVIIDGKRYAGKDLALKVMTVEVDTVNKDSMLIPFGVQSAPTTFAEWIPVLLAALLLIAFTLLAFYLYRRLKDNKPILRQLRFIRRQPPHHKATKALTRLRQQHAKSKIDIKEYYTHLTDILRRYLGDQQHFDAMEMTTEEILRHLQQSDIGTHNDKLAPLLRTADLVKFAKHTTTEDVLTRHTEDALNYVAMTKDNTLPEEEKETVPYTAQEQRSIHVRRLLKILIAALIVGIITVGAYIVWKLTWLI